VREAHRCNPIGLVSDVLATVRAQVDGQVYRFVS